MALISFVLPTRDPPSLALEHLGLGCFLVAGLVALFNSWLSWRWPSFLYDSRYDTTILVISNLCVMRQG